MTKKEAQAIILVGGQGSRLRPLTTDTPKPMLPIGGIPVIQHQIYKLKDAGITKIILGTSFKAEIFKDAFGDGSSMGVSLEYAFEEEPLGTGGAIRNAGKLLTNDPSSPVVVFNGDIMCNLDIASLVKHWKDNQADVSLYLTTVEDPKAFGLVPTDESNNVLAFTEKPKTDAEVITNQINAGCYVFKHSIIDTIPDDRPVSVERETFPQILQSKLKMTGYIDTGYWLDLGTPQSFIVGSRDFVHGLIKSSAFPHLGTEALVKKTARISSDAVVNNGSFIADSVVIKGNTKVSGSAIFEGAVIGDNCIIKNSIVGKNVVIASGTVLRDAIIGNRAWIGSDNELINGARVWSDVTVPDKAIRFSGDN
jgi:mannose-1-phosphate guanylyltransferase